MLKPGKRYLRVCMLLLAGLAAAFVPLLHAAEVKAPAWLHGLDLKCRKGTEKEFTADTKVFGVEAFKDENNAGVVYISQEGAVSVYQGDVMLKAPSPESKAPSWMHGLDLKVREGGIREFEKAKLFGVE